MKISRHTNHVFRESELDLNAVVAFCATTAVEGKPCDVKHYNLDTIISAGYRVKSTRGTKFRQWVTKVLNGYLVDGYVVNISRLENENQKLKELQNII